MPSAGNEPKKAQGNFRDTIIEIGRSKSSTVSVFSDFCKVVACCLALQTREDEYLEVAKRYTTNELNQFSQAMAQLITEMENAPFKDLLGPFYQENASKSSVTSRGEFYTPPEVSQLIGRVLMNPSEIIATGKPITVSDPCVGSGGMILSIAELFAADKAVDLLRVSAIDLSPLACDMTYINTTLWGIPATITWGNTLSMELQRTWKNIHWVRVGEDSRRAVERMQDVLNTTFVPTDSNAQRTDFECTSKSDITLPDDKQRRNLQQGQFDLGFFE